MNLLKKLKVRSLRKALFEAGFQQRDYLERLVVKEIIPYNGKPETEKYAREDRGRYSDEDLIELANKVIAVYGDRFSEDHEVYIASGKLFGIEEPFVFFSRDARRRE